MATFTVTASQNIDALAGKTGGDVYNINGWTLTIDQDSRSGLNQSTSASWGNVTISSTLWGKVIIDTSLVREIPFDTGLWVVPAFNTVITQWLASWLLIAVYTTRNSWPIASGGAMPATGFIKIKQRNSVAFTSGALIGITANATDADKQGWIEIVADQAATMTLVRLWAFECNKNNPNLLYEIGTTNWSIWQVLQTPTFGGTNSYIPWLWIEDWSGWLEQWNGVYSTTYSTTNFGTDIRSKVFHALANGEIRFGSDWTSSIWYVPPTGRKVYIPTVILRQTSAANRTLNLLPFTTLTSRPEFSTAGGWVLNMNSHIWDWYFNFSQAYSINMRNFAYFDSMQIINTGSKPDCRNFICGNSLLVAAAAAYPLVDQLNSFWSYFENCNLVRTGTAWSCFVVYIAGTVGPEYKNVKTGIITFARWTAPYWLYATQSPWLIVDWIETTNCWIWLATCVDFNITWHDFCNNYLWNTASTPTALYNFIPTSSCANWIYENFTYWKYWSISNTHPYNGVFSPQYCSNIIVRNWGTAASPLNGGTANQASYILADLWNNVNIKIQRVYLSATRTAAWLSSASSKNIVMENCSSTLGTIWIWQSVSTVKWLRANTLSTSWQPACYGTHRYNTFLTDTTGVVTVAMNEATPETLSQVDVISLSANAWFTSNWQISIPEIWEQIIRTTPYYIKGYTAFTNTALNITGTSISGITYEYQIDVNDWNWFNGTWKTANGPTLSWEIINAVNGFKLKLRITTTTTVSWRALVYVRFNMTTAAIAQRELYPLTISNRTYELTWLTVWTEVVIFDASNNEIDREIITGTTYTYNYEWNSDDWDSTGYALIWKDNKKPIKLTVDYIDENQSTPISQSDDLVYNGSYTSVSNIDYANKLQILTTQNVSIPYLYSEWKESILQGNNSQYDFAYEVVGGNTVVGATTIPDYVFQDNGWKIRPMEANGTTNMIDGIIVAESGDPFVNTLGAYTVRINYQNPVQALTVSTSGWTLTASDVWSYNINTHNVTNSTGNWLKTINQWIQKASLIIPHTENI